VSQDMDPIPRTPKEMGELIRARRESLGLTLENVRDTTFIRQKHLQAVEEGDDTQIPTAYFKGFLKSYANALGLDGYRMSIAYQEFLDKEQDPNKHHRYRRRPTTKNVSHSDASPEPPSGHRISASPTGREEPRKRVRRPRRGRPSLTFFVILFAVALGIYFLASSWGLFSHEANLPPGNPENPEDPDPPETETPVDEEPPPLPKVWRTDPNREKTIWETDAESLVLTVTVSSEEGSSCWVRVSQDGTVVLEDTLQRAQHKEFQATDEIIIRAGKPWVLALSLGGVDLGPGGDYGPVKDLVFRRAKTP
jgi:cytoskeleton protein RodZ